MKSEIRANWIFLGLFMLVMAPGLTILTMKAYKRGGAAGMNPPAPKTVSAYNNPNPQDPSLPRLVPPRTAGFVESITQRIVQLQPELTQLRKAEGVPPTMSEKRMLEVVALGGDSKSYYVAMVGWHRGFAPLPSLYRFSVTRGGVESSASVAAYEQLNLPIETRTELQQYGYTLPPDSVLWMILKADGGEPVDRLDMTYTFDGKAIDDRVILGPPATSQRSHP